MRVADRFAQLFALRVEGVGCHRQDGHGCAVRQRTNGPCRFQAARSGHVHVHQDQVTGHRLSPLQRVVLDRQGARLGGLRGKLLGTACPLNAAHLPGASHTEAIT